MNQANISVDFSEITGRIKPMHSVNNGPIVDRAHAASASNAIWFTKAGIPFARNHDANFAPNYGAPHTVDIIAIFPNFDADENDPASYDFHLTDEYNANIMYSQTKVYYRLGNKIEHQSKRYGALPPKDPHKWARICEHIIRHMNEGWADGTHLGIEYWEIWNEPDLHPQCWDGPDEAFYDLFDITARHLKSCFPHLKIGGPAVTSTCNHGFLVPMFDYLTRNPDDPTPLDFFSFHIYATTPEQIAEQPAIARALLDRYSYPHAETILNEWNYVRGWDTPGLRYSYSVIPALKGSAFVASTILSCQKTCLNHLMYYDARIRTSWNGLFDEITYEPLKPYYAIYAFGQLYRLGLEVLNVSDTASVYSGAAISEDQNKAAIVITHYEDLESIDGRDCEEHHKTLRLDWSGYASDDGVRVTYHLLDRDHSCEPIFEEIVYANRGTHSFELPMYTTLLITLEKL